jgi:hypothetical protein
VAYGPQVVLYDGRREAFGGKKKARAVVAL